MAYLHKCWAKEKDCFAMINGGQCAILSQTKFGNKGCPFYKPFDMVNTRQIENDIKIYAMTHSDDPEEDSDDTEG